MWHLAVRGRISTSWVKNPYLSGTKWDFGLYQHIPPADLICLLTSVVTVDDNINPCWQIVWVD